MQKRCAILTLHQKINTSPPFDPPPLCICYVFPKLIVSVHFLPNAASCSPSSENELTRCRKAKIGTYSKQYPSRASQVDWSGSQISSSEQSRPTIYNCIPSAIHRRNGREKRSFAFENGDGSWIRAQMLIGSGRRGIRGWGSVFTFYWNL